MEYSLYSENKIYFTVIKIIMSQKAKCMNKSHLHLFYRRLKSTGSSSVTKNSLICLPGKGTAGSTPLLTCLPARVNDSSQLKNVTTVYLA